MNTPKTVMFNKELAAMRRENLQHEFLTYIYLGKDLSEACALVKVNPAVLGLIRAENVTFDSEIRKAQAFRVELMVDRLENIHTVVDEAAMAAVVSRNIQWLASKRMREIYGDKVDVNHNVRIDIKAAIADARSRVIENESPKLLNDNTHATDSTSAAPLEIDPLS